MARLHPGVYVQEVSSGVRPIEGVSTSTGGFVGKAAQGPVGQAVLVTRLTEFTATFGSFLPDSWLAHAVTHFFQNGGQRCYVVRVASADTRTASITLRDRKTAPARTIVVSATSPGDWGNVLDLVVTNGTRDPENEFNLAVLLNRGGQNPPLDPLPLESIENLSMNPAAPNYVERVVAQSSQRVTVTVDAANLATAGPGRSRGGRLAVGNGADVLKLGTAAGGTETAGAGGAPATAGTSRSGDTPSTNPPADRRGFRINLDGDGAQPVTIASAAATGPELAQAIQNAVRALTPNDSLRQAAYSGFTCTYETPGGPNNPFYLLTSGTQGPGSTVVVTPVLELAGQAAALLGLGVARGGTEAPGTAAPTAGTSRSADNPATSLPADSRQFVVNLDADGPRPLTLAGTASTGAGIATAIQTAVRGLTANTATNQAAYDGFTATFETPASPNPPFYRLTSGTQGATSSVVVTDATRPTTGIRLGAGPRRLVVDINRDGPHQVTITGPLADGNAIATALQTAVRAVTPNRAANATAFTGFTCAYDNAAGPANPSFLLTSGAPGTGSVVRVTNGPGPADNAAGVLRLGLTNGGAEVTGAALLRPANSGAPTEYHVGEAIAGGNVDAATPGADGSPPGDNEHTAGLTAFDTVRDVNLIAIPGIASPAVSAAGVNYCTQRADCFFIADMNATDDTVKEAVDFTTGLTVKTSYGAVYYPWLKAADPTGNSVAPILVPPSGAVMGVFARIDGRRGVWKAPAGTEANVGTAIGLSADTTDVQQDSLNPIGVNVIRQFPASGIVVWGARTLATLQDPEYRYIPVRRLAIFLEQSISNGIQFAVFEPNDEPLWASLRLNITAFMSLQFRAGAFQGRTAGEAFFVKCDSGTNTQADIDAGVVNILVGFAPLKPAEFVVLTITQKTGQPV